MNLFEKIDDVLEQENSILPKDKTKVKSEFTFDEKMFSKMANFIINLEPDKLSDDQIQEVINMIESFEVESIDEKRRLAKKSTLNKNQYSKKWYRSNKTEIKNRKEKFARSSEGRKRGKVKGRMSRAGRTATGRGKVEYNRRKRWGG